MIRTAESVSPMHPDKICDRISDAIVDAYLKEDKDSRCAVEVMGGHELIQVMGEVTSKAKPSIREIVRRIAGNLECNIHPGCIKKLLDNLRWHRANYQTPQHVEPMFPVTKSLMGSLIPVLQDALSENAKMKSELQEANTKLTMYEARHETDKGTIEQLKEELKEAQEAFDTYNYSTHEVGKLKN